MESKTEKRTKNLIPFKKGQSGNPKGRPLGQKNYSTLYKEALIKIAKSQGKTPEDIEADLVESGILRGIKGNFKFYEDVMNRVHGKPVNNVDMNIKGKIVNKIEVEFKDFGEDENNTE